MHSQYDELTIEMIIEFYFEFKLKIDKKMFTEAMKAELHLIKEAAKNKGILILA
ncbi:hypothetical protein [Bacillus sp. SA1-12]|uniref:hypothetical protein n=1 Tax=Bacillus sp. SA1-12 TaxID=1455638 RepID=UPI000AB62358|nr:hypothetical protein [Bacillus sp. SA1-12]